MKLKVRLSVINKRVIEGEENLGNECVGMSDRDKKVEVVFEL